MITINISEFYKDAVGEVLEVEVNNEVYELLINTFRKEAHAEEMRDIRHIDVNGYSEGTTEMYTSRQEQAVEEYVMLQMDKEVLRQAFNSLSLLQQERIYLYFFCNLSTREIADKTGVSQNVVWKSIQRALNKLKKFFV